jgi:hypothetical protein
VVFLLVPLTFLLTFFVWFLSQNEVKKAHLTVEELRAQVSVGDVWLVKECLHSPMCEQQATLAPTVVPAPVSIPDHDRVASTDAGSTPSPEKPMSPSHLDSAREPVPSDAEALHNVSVKAARAIFESARKSAHSVAKP